MFAYEKKLQYPVCIKRPNAKLAKLVITQLGGPNAEKIQSRSCSAEYPNNVAAAVKDYFFDNSKQCFIEYCRRYIR